MSFLKLSCLLSRSYLKANKYTGRAEQLMNGVFPFQKRKKLFFGPTKHGSGRWKVDSKISQELDNNVMPVRWRCSLIYDDKCFVTRRNIYRRMPNIPARPTITKVKIIISIKDTGRRKTAPLFSARPVSVWEENIKLPWTFTIFPRDNFSQFSFQQQAGFELC